MLPNFLIIGAARSGTTSIYHNLREHPDVFMPTKKEPQFFTTNWDKGIAWYESLFQNCASQNAVGEASMTYTYPQFENAAVRIARFLPKAKLIYILRNPIERAYSHYNYYKNYRGDEKLVFEQAIEEHPIYRETGNYYTLISRYLQHFDKSRLHVVLYDDYLSDPIGAIKGIFRFLDVDESFVPCNIHLKTNASFKPRNALIYGLWRQLSLSRVRSFTEKFIPEVWRPRLRNAIHRFLGKKECDVLPNSVRDYLRNYYENELIDLEKFLGKDLSNWMR